MVRLKADNAQFNQDLGTLFQFHYGSIKSFKLGSVDNDKYLFQFHYGSIKREEILFRH